MKQALLALFMVGAMLSAQGRGGRPGAGPANSSASRLDMAKVQTVEGVVTALNLAYGAQYPVVQIGNAQVKIAPAWFFLEKNFELRAGDPLRVSAVPSVVPGDAFLYAIQIVNTATNAWIVLRDSDGLPLWAGRGAGSGKGNGPGTGAGLAASCIDAATVATATGTVESASLAAGFEMPMLTMKTADGALTTVKIGPERILLDADVELQAGQTVTLRYAKSACRDGELVALQVTLADGRTIVLRHDDGRPAWD